jgi:hypothetical protein
MTQKFNTKTCCGKILVTWKLGFQVTKELINYLSNSFKEHNHFTKSGMLYMDNQSLVISGQLGSNSIQIRCKSKNCEQAMNDLESKISSYERNLQINK